MIFVDSNIPMYLIGAPHRHKVEAGHLVEELISRREKLVTDAEVLQEILHRYGAIGRRDAIQPAFDAVRGLIDEIFPIEARDVQQAKVVMLGRAAVSAREAIHLAVMKRRGIHRILSFDSGFDAFPGVRRITSV